LDSGETDQIAVDIYVPPGSQETVNILTLIISGKPEISKKTVHIFVKNAFSKVNMKKCDQLIQEFFLYKFFDINLEIRRQYNTVQKKIK